MLTWEQQREQELNNYALKLLADTGCNIYTYGGKESVHILEDLKKGFPEGLKFPLVDVANAILSVSRPEPIYRAPWRMVLDTDNDVDGVDCDSFEQAKIDALDTLIEWATEQCSGYDAEVRNWTEKQRDDYDYMVYNCSVAVYKYNPNTDEYEHYWTPTYKDKEEIGWCTCDILEKRQNQYIEEQKRKKQSDTEQN
jgi:hypothetical protein